MVALRAELWMNQCHMYLPRTFRRIDTHIHLGPFTQFTHLQAAALMQQGPPQPCIMICPAKSMSPLTHGVRASSDVVTVMGLPSFQPSMHRSLLSAWWGGHNSL
ncbi:hypothetical protein VNO77_44675 [Canavalia gladiata]|uniref:Uncharacterized protein n=1 Tax=Canavalia gladiata TaxID=3824 RepID=A0AAN9JWE0_CANGL